MSWLYLILAIVFEVIGTALLKVIQHPISIKTAIMLVCYVLSLLLLSMTLKKMDIGVVYAIWSGIGITAIEVIGVVYFKESMSISKIIFIALILIGTVGLNFSRSS